MSWLKVVVSKIFPQKPPSNLNSDKSFDEKVNELGVFQYDELGFTISYNKFLKKLMWEEITHIHVFKRDLFAYDRIEMEIVHGYESFTIHEDLPGWYQFKQRMNSTLEITSKDWEINIVQPPFATNFTTIYDRDKLNKNINPFCS